MPGLFGISRRVAAERLSTTFEHMLGPRGEIQRETRIDASHLWAIGRTHLGVLQPAPQLDEESSVQVLFHGDLYNESDLAAECACAGTTGANRTTAVLKNLYERYGCDFASHLDGAFCVAIVDANQHRLVLAGDVVGSYPLYWTLAGDELVFASELRAVLRHPAVRRTLDPSAVGDCLTFGFPLGTKTLAEHVSVLPAASTLTFDWDTGAVRVHRRASLLESSTPWTGTRAEYYDALKQSFAVSVRRSLSGPHRFGLSLSGGLDSRAILGSMNGQAATLQTYTLGVRGCADQVIADRLAGISGTSHSFFELSDEYLRDFLPSLREMVRLTDGMYLSHGLTEMLALGFLRHAGFSVLLRGHGGELAKTRLAWPWHTDARVHEIQSRDELLEYLLNRAGYVSAGASWRELFHDEWFARVDGAPRQSLSESLGGLTLKSADSCSHLYLNELHRRFTVPSIELFRQVVEVRQPFVDPSFLRVLFQGDARWREDTSIHQGLTAGRRGLLSVRNSNTGAPADAGPLAEFVFDKLNTVLRRAGVYGYRHYHNFHEWMREQLLQSVEAVLLDPASLDRGMLREAALRQLIDHTRQGRSDHSYLLQGLLILELWQRDNL